MKTEELLMSNNGWNLEYIDNLMPWQKDFYRGMLLNRQLEIKQAIT